jgi:DNA-binding transcriptional ArsR family regulator
MSERLKRPFRKVLQPDLFKALGDPTRSDIFAILVTKAEPVNVTEVWEGMGKSCAFRNVSHHLRILKNAGLASHIRRGKEMLYWANNQVFRDALSSIIEGIPLSEDE